MLISMIKTGYEDVLRHLADRRLNNRKTVIQKGEVTETVQWREVNPGDVLVVSTDEEFPADCVILDCTSADKLCRIETVALDGETSLKFRTPVDVELEELWHGFEVEISNPVPCISSFRGNIRVADRIIPLSNHNLVPRGCFLRKTDSVKALAVYTGKDTKVMLNAMKPKFKYTEIDKFLARVVIVLVCVLFTTASVMDACSYFWSKRNRKQEHLNLAEQPNIYYVYNWFSWFLLINCFIPLCVYSSLDLCRFLISLTISFDTEMYEGDKHTVCRNSDLCSTIGRITHIFSDKTGTITKNKMTFRAIGFDHELIGCDTPRDEADVFNTERMVSMPEDSVEYITSLIPTSHYVRDLLLNMCLCHSAIPAVNTHAYKLQEIRDIFPNFEFTQDVPPPDVVARFPYTVSYRSSSPDEIAFLHFARECGYVLYKVARSNVHIIINGTEHVFFRPVCFDFTSSRKRQSVLAKIDSVYRLLTKGAEVALIARSVECSSVLSANIDRVSKNGLRTLVFAEKVAPDAESIISEYNEIKHDIIHGEERLLALADEVENEFRITGVTGVLDELQDDVADTLARLKQANIKVWMLTGDNLETGLNIAASAGLVENRDSCVAIDSLEDLSKFDNVNIRNSVITIEGHNFDTLFRDSRFLEIAAEASSVVCARLEPGQKGNAVRLFKGHNKNACVLTVGDGANDVDMIRVADVGVGVEGCEGSDAVLSSDFSIVSFKHLARLLLVHGRWSVNRVALLIILTFYKSTLLGGAEILYGLVNGFSAAAAFDSGYLSVFNLLLTIPQLFFGCVMEQDVDAKLAMEQPRIYTEFQKDGGLGIVPFAGMYIRSLVHLLSFFLFAYFDTTEVCLNNSGSTFDFPMYTQLNAWTVLILFTIECMMSYTVISPLHIFFYIGCIAIYGLVEFMYSQGDKQFFHILAIAATIPRMWIVIPYAVMCSVIANFVWLWCRRRSHYS